MTDSIDRTQQDEQMRQWLGSVKLPERTRHLSCMNAIKLFVVKAMIFSSHLRTLFRKISLFFKRAAHKKYSQVSSNIIIRQKNSEQWGRIGGASCKTSALRALA